MVNEYIRSLQLRFQVQYSISVNFDDFDGILTWTCSSLKKIILLYLYPMPLSNNENQLGSFSISICELLRHMNRYGYAHICIYDTRFLFTYIGEVYTVFHIGVVPTPYI